MESIEFNYCGVVEAPHSKLHNMRVLLKQLGKLILPSATNYSNYCSWRSLVPKLLYVGHGAIASRGFLTLMEH
ncbi:MAG: hypothetical protein QXS70_07140 [Desulfurococcaceae archaeon]